MRQFLAGFLVAVSAACGGAAGTSVYAPGVALMADRVDAGGGASTYTDASYLANKSITTHAYYGFLDASRIGYSGAQPIYGHASFNDNTTFEGAVASDHHHSFQSAAHYGASANLGELTSFQSQVDVTAGSVGQVAGMTVADPTGTGVIGTLMGVRVGPLTRGSVNWGVYVDGTPSYFGGPVQLKVYAAASAPEAKKGALVVVEDETGIYLALGDGLAWHRLMKAN
jgi:hypothetical protein